MRVSVIAALVLVVAPLPAAAQEGPPEVTEDTVLLIDFNAREWADRASAPNELALPEAAGAFDASGRFGGCFSCDGRDDRLIVRAGDELQAALAGAFTFEAYVRLRDLPWERQYYPCVVAARADDGKLSWYLDVHKYGNIPRVLAYVDDQEKEYVQAESPRGPKHALQARQWYHLAVTCDGQDLRLFTDGVLKASVKLTKPLRPTAELCLGGRFGKGHLSGWLDEVRISRAMLYDTETSAAAAERNRAELRQASRERFEEYRLPEDPRWGTLHARLLFGAEDMPRLREQMNQPAIRPYYDQLLDACEGMVNADDRRYLDPAKDYGFGAGVPIPGEKCCELALAYVLTDRREFADHALAVLSRWSARLGYEDAVHPHDWVGAGWMVASMGLCYDWLYGAMTAEQRASLRMGIAELCQAIYDNTNTEQFVDMSVRNWQAMAAGGLGLGGLAIKGETTLPAHRWVRRAEAFLAHYYDYAIGRGGAPIEGVAYFYYGQPQAIVFAKALKFSGGRDLFRTTNLARVQEFIPYALMPWGRYFQNLKFGHWNRSTFYHVPLILRREFGGLSEWAWQKAWGRELHYPCELLGLLWLPGEAEVVTPEQALPLDRHFPDRGLVVMRSGWDDDAVVATLDAGRYQMAAHDQADRGNVTFLGRRNHWLVDSGYGSPNEPQGSTSTFGHNLVVVDGKGQCLEKPNSRTDAFITHFLSTEEFALARADLKPAYDYWYDWDYLRVGPYDPVERATRAVVFARGAHPYLLIADRVKKDAAEHEYVLFLHTHPTNSVELRPDGAAFEPRAHAGSYLCQPAQAGKLGPLDPNFQVGGQAEYDFEIEQAGEYVLWGCGMAGQYVPGATDSFFVDLGDHHAVFSVSGEPWLKWRMVQFGGSPTNSAVHLEPGKHTLVVRTREPDAQLWYLCLTAEDGDRPHLYDLTSGPRSLFIKAGEPTRLTEPMAVASGRYEPLAPAHCELRVLSPSDPALEQDIYLTSQVGVHPRVIVCWRGVEARFVTLHYPRSGEMPELEMRQLPAQGGRAFELSWPGSRDLLLLSEGGTVSADNVSTDADLALVRFAGGNPRAVAVIGATELTVAGKALLSAARPFYAAGEADKIQVATVEPTASLEAPSPE